MEWHREKRKRDSSLWWRLYGGTPRWRIASANNRQQHRVNGGGAAASAQRRVAAKSEKPRGNGKAWRKA